MSNQEDHPAEIEPQETETEGVRTNSPHFLWNNHLGRHDPWLSRDSVDLETK